MDFPPVPLWLDGRTIAIGPGQHMLEVTAGEAEAHLVKSPPWSMKLGMTRWNEDPAYP